MVREGVVRRHSQSGRPARHLHRLAADRGRSVGGEPADDDFFRQGRNVESAGAPAHRLETRVVQLYGQSGGYQQARSQRPSSDRCYGRSMPRAAMLSMTKTTHRRNRRHFIDGLGIH